MLALCCTLPLAGAFALSTVQMRDALTGHVVRGLEGALARMHADLAREVERRVAVLDALKGDAELAPADLERCARRVGRLRRDLPDTRPAVFGLDGAPACLAPDAPPAATPGAQVADRGYFRAALAGDAPRLGEPVVGRLSGRAVLPIAVAARDPGSRLPVAVVASSIDLEAFVARARGDHGPTGSTLTLWRADGLVLGRSPDPEGLTRAPLGGTATFARLRDAGDAPSGAFRERGLDGVARVYAFRRIELPGGVGGPLRATLGVPEAELLAATDRVIDRTVVALAAVTALALGLALLTAEALVRRPLARLAGAVASAGRRGGGALEAVAGAGAVREVAALARALDALLGAPGPAAPPLRLALSSGRGAAPSRGS